MLKFLRDLVFKDLWLKLFSLTLAVLTWLIVSFTIQREVSSPLPMTLNAKEHTFNVPVVVLSSAEDVHNFKVVPNEVEVTVRGNAKLLRSLDKKDIRAIVDLTGIGRARELHKRIDVSTPAGVTHVLVEPQEVEVIYPPKG